MFSHKTHQYTEEARARRSARKKIPNRGAPWGNAEIPHAPPMQKVVFFWMDESRLQISYKRPPIYDTERIVSNVGRTHYSFDVESFQPPRRD